MWFGDLVTMRWWDDLWLNESFAEWASHYANTHATRFTDAWATFANSRKAWAYRQDQLPSTHPIAADMVDLETVYTNFDGITYAKGASALRQLVAFVGEQDFLRGLRNYFSHYAWSNTSLSDLLAELADASGRDLSQWTQQWLQTSGVNLLRAAIADAPDGGMAEVTVVQSPPALPEGVAPTLRDHRIAIGVYNFDGAALTRTERIELDVTGAQTPVPALSDRARPDLLLLNDDDLTFAKIRLDARSLETVTAHFGGVADPLARALLRRRRAQAHDRPRPEHGALPPHRAPERPAHHHRPDRPLRPRPGARPRGDRRPGRHRPRHRARPAAAPRIR